MILVKGNLLAIETGEYSDRYTMDHVRVLQDFDSKEAERAFWIHRGGDDGEYHPLLQDAFVAWLQAMGFVSLSLDNIQTLHIGCYGRLEVD